MFGNKRKDVKPSHPPCLNKFMHPRNPYKNLPSFKELAINYPEFRSHCSFDFKGKAFLDFKNSEALRTLTTSLLHKDFGLTVQIPNDRLVPTLPLRMNYLLWIEDLLSLVFPKITVPHQKAPLVGIDIGTGAACIYPLLGNKKFGWNFVATETDLISHESAISNVDNNNLKENILVIQSSELFDVLNKEEVRKFVQKKKINSKDLPDGTTSKDDNQTSSLSYDDCNNSYLIDFAVCNPPFFSSEVEMDTNHNSKKETRSQPNSVSTGCIQEKITDGGEITFITKLIEQSIHHKGSVRIFSTLIGIKADVKVVINLIKEKAKDIPVCITDTEFCQGRTMRWGVAWSFCSQIPLERVVSKKKKLSQKPFVLQIPRSLMSIYTVGSVWSLIQSWLKDIKIKPQIIKSTKYYMFVIVKAYKPTWLHQRQKRRQKFKTDTSETNTQDEEINSEYESSPIKRKSEEEVEGNLLKRLKLQMEESNVEIKARENHVEESEEMKINESNKEIQENYLNEEQINQSDEEVVQMNEEKSHSESNVDDIPVSENQTSSCYNFPHNSSSEKGITKFRNSLPVYEDDTQSNPKWKNPQFSVPVNEKGVKAGLEYHLKCSMQLKQTEALISLDLNFLSGVGQKEALHQLLQYINNRLRQNK